MVNVYTTSTAIAMWVSAATRLGLALTARYEPAQERCRGWELSWVLMICIHWWNVPTRGFAIEKQEVVIVSMDTMA